MNVIDALSDGVRDFEAALLSAGWQDGWHRKDTKKPQFAPYFYRNSTDVSALDSKVNIDGQSEILYMIYTDTGTDTFYSGNRSHFHQVNLTLNIFYSNSALFDEGTYDNMYARFLSDLIDELTGRMWTISDDGEDGTASDDSGSVYLNRKTMYIHKVF